MAKTGSRGRDPEALRRYRKAASAITGHPQPDLGGNYIRAKNLIVLRNALMHYRARWPSDLQMDEAAFFQALKATFSPNRFYPEPQNEFWPKGILGAGCAKWAVETSDGLTTWFDGLLK